MQSLVIKDTQVLVLSPDESDGGKGGLFERFIAKLLADQYGFQDPTTRNVNVTSEGIELDVVARHRLTGSTAIAECKAYARNIRASELTNFYGKLTIERFDDPDAFGLFCALPRLTADGEEKARAIEKQDKSFKYLSGEDLATALRQGGLIAEPPASVGEISDRAVVITNDGVFGAAIVLDPVERTPTHVAAWAVGGSVPQSALELLRGADYSEDMSVVDPGAGGSSPVAPLRTRSDPDRVMLTSVVGSTSDFEYQLPASPKFFIGRGNVLSRLNEALDTARGTVLVLNAQSGWGKSSLALKMNDLAVGRRGVALTLDTRTADHPRYVVEVLRKVAGDAEAAGILTLPKEASWASLESALSTLRQAAWNETDRPLLVFFDQFENVFRDVDLTRSFRDLALGSRDIPGPLVIGYAWKTDLVGWTEGHPYQLRDDIRGAGVVVSVEPFGPNEVTVLLTRLEKQAKVRLLPDLRSRLRAYSQGPLAAEEAGRPRSTRTETGRDPRAIAC